MQAQSFFFDMIQGELSYMQFVLGPASWPTDMKAQLLLLATAGQESNWKDRLQIGGPAHGFWQFERGGGVAEVYGNPHTRAHLQAICAHLEISFAQSVIFEAMVWNDRLACAMARLNYWRDPHPLPEIGDEEGAWQYYLRVWAPGKPDRARWTARYKTSWETIAPLLTPAIIHIPGIPSAGGIGQPGGSSKT